MSLEVEVDVDGRKHTVLVGRERAVQPEDGKFRAFFVPAIEGVDIYPSLVEEGASTVNDLLGMLGEWNGALANLKFD